MDPVVRAYSARATEYADALGSMAAVDPDDRSAVSTWASAQTGLLVDLGSGPGHWSAFLAGEGHRVVGVEPTPEFRSIARERFPGVDVRDGRAEALPFEDASVGGVLAWYSLIHLGADGLRAALEEVARVLRTGGGLLLGFFEGPVREPFDHAVVQASRWPVAEVVDLLETTGFAVSGVWTRTRPPHRPHGAVRAVRGSSRG